MREILRAEFKGEAPMKEALSLLVDSRVFLDNASPSFLVNPDTGEKLEFDRYYPKDDVVFEFDGAQHYVATERYDEEAVRKQRLRDAAKRDICAESGIRLWSCIPRICHSASCCRRSESCCPCGTYLAPGPSSAIWSRRAQPIGGSPRK